MAYTPKPEHIRELPRHKCLSRNRAYLKSCQYKGKPDWFTGKGADGKQVPLRERAPCIIYPLPKAAVNQIVRFTFGESRFPTINVEKAEKDEAVDGLTLSEKDAETLETFVAALIESSRLKPGMRRVMRPGLATGSVCVIVALKRGQFVLQVANAEDVWPTFEGDDPAADVTKITWCYQTEQTVDGPAGGKPETKLFWYRQDVDAEGFHEFALVPLEAGKDPAWGTPKTTPHGFGVCPVVWIRNLAEEESTSIDGVSVYGEQHAEFDALNFALSQRHRGITYFGSPQAYETGVEDDDGPQAEGRAAGPAGFQGAESPHGAAKTPARKIAPDQIWSYRNDKAKAALIETTGKAFEVSTLHVNDIRSRVLESMSVVLVNVSDIMGRTQQGQMSAKFLELAYEPLLALVDEMRHLWWFDGLQRILSLMLRIVAELGGERLLVPGADKAAKLLAGSFVTVADADGAPQRLWMPPKMTPNWGDYFAAGPEEITAAIDAATKAKDASLIPDDDAAKYVLPYFGREDVSDALEEIEEDKAEAQEKALEQTTAEAGALHAIANGPGPAGGKRPGGPAQKPGPGGGASGSAPPKT